MNSETATQTFNLLSIGQRGVGKTVFLAGSYAELRAAYMTKRWQKLWFDCQDSQAQENIDSILSYMVQTGKYPPPTNKITKFSFSLKHRRLWSTQTLCHFRWSDIPGEICTVQNRDFRAMVSNSHACCVFIDAYALVHKKTYIQALENIIKQVMAIASLAHLHDWQYPFVVILTKCDLLEPSYISQQLEQILQPLTTRLDAVRANYQTFYSFIPLVRTPGVVTLKPTGAASPLLWLVWELSQPDNTDLKNNLLQLIARLWSNSFQPFQELIDGVRHRRVTVANPAVGVKQKRLDPYLLPAAVTRKNLLALALVVVALVVFIGLVSPYWNRSESHNEPKNLTTP